MTRPANPLPRTIARAFAVLLFFLATFSHNGAQAAITVAAVTQAATTTAATTQNTAAFTPAANTLYLMWTVQTIGASPPTTPTVACANGLTMVQVNTVAYGTIATPLNRVTLFRGLRSTAGTNNTCTITWGQTTTGHGHAIVAFTGTDITGTNGSGAIAQSVTGATNSASAAAGLSMTLGALTAGSTTAGGFSNNINSATGLTAGGGYTANTLVRFGTPSTALRAEWRVAGSTTVNMTQSATSHIGGIAVEVLARPTTTLANGAAPANVTIGPGAAATDLDYFTLTSSSGTDTVTAATVTLTPAGAFNNIGQVDLTDNANNPLCTAVTNPASNTISFTGCNIPVTTAATTFKVRITPDSHANMPAVPGASYATTGTVTAFTNSNLQAGTDASSATVTVDNLSPGNATAPVGSPGDGQIVLNWTNPASADLNSLVVLRNTIAVADTPVEGTAYSVGNTIGASTVACVVTAPTATCTDTGLVNGTAYYYRIFAKDNYGNYAQTGLAAGPFTPVTTTTLATGTDPAANTIGPGAAATDVNQFTFQTGGGTSTITSVTVNLSTNTGVGRLAITDNADTELGFTTTPASGTNTITVAGMTATTTLTTFKVRVTPLSHAAMPAVPGASYAITAPVTAWAGTNSHAGSDTNANALTIDNLSPGNATGATAGSSVAGQISLSWTNPANADLNSLVVLRNTVAVANTPVEGTTYSVGDTIGASTVACVVTAPTAACTDAGLSSGTAYYYKIFAKDNYGNYASGGLAAGPFTPLAAPTVAKSFATHSIAAGAGTSVMTITITNPNNVAITGLAFTDTYPANLLNAAAATKTCTGGTLTGANNGTFVSLTGSQVGANSSCTVTATVDSATPGTYLNSTGQVTSTNAPTGIAASDTLTVFGAATKLAFYQQPGNTTVSTTIAPPITVQIQDANGNVVTTDTRTVTLSKSCGGTLGGTPAKAAVAGVATFNDLTISAVATGCTLTATSSPALTSDTSGSFDITPLPATQLAFSVQPSNAPPNTAISPAVKVEIRDASNSVVTTSTANVTLALGANPGSGVLAGTLTQQAVAGVATFANLSINNSGSGYTLTAASSGLTGATSNTFNITTATQIAFYQQPSNTPQNTSIAPAVTVRILDAANNVVTTSTDTVTMTIDPANNPGGGTLSGTVSVAAVAGVATFSDLSINNVGTGYKLKATATPLATPVSATSGSFNITTLDCFTDTFTDLSNWSVGKQMGSFTPAIVSGRLRITDATTTQATWATLSRVFPGAGNKVVAEFDQFAYGGAGGGGDGMAIILSNAAIGPVAGAFGGSMGYAQKGQNPVSDCNTVGGCPGFAGGWVGVALDEYGNYSTNTEGRVGGSASTIPDSVAVRGSGSGMSGYRYLKGTGSLNPLIDGNGAAAPPYRYRLIVDHRDGVHAWVSVERDTSGGGTNYGTPLIGAANCDSVVTANCFDIKDPLYSQDPVPTNWSFSFTGSTGAATNIHEVGNVKICTAQGQVIPVLDHIELDYGAQACTTTPPTVTVKACADAGCTSLYAGSVTVNLSASGGAWSTNPVTFTGGQASVTLTSASAQTVTLGGTATSPTTGNATLCNTGAGAAACGSNPMTFSVCTFDVIEVGAAAATPIYTKLAGTGFSLKVLSQAATSQTVGKVEIVNASSGTCATYASLSNSTTAVPSAFAAGTNQTFAFNYNNAFKNARIRVLYGTTTPYTQNASCSFDNFAIRPTSFTVTSSATQSASSGTPVFKAGSAPFSFTATALTSTAATATGYDGTPKADGTTPGKITTALANLGTLGAVTFDPAASGVATKSGFTYSEVGNFSLGANAVYDDGFALVDSNKQNPDCTSDFSNTLVSGRYGCMFGSPAAGPFGRFIPDHFALSGISLINRGDINGGAGCSPASTFTYMGEPMRVGFTLTAQNAASNATLNYSGAYAKFSNPANWTTYNTAGANTVGLWAVANGYSVSPGTCNVLFSNATPGVTSYACSGVANPASFNRTAGPRVTVAPVSVSTWDNVAVPAKSAGVANFIADVTLQRADAADGPYNTLKIGVAPQDTDGVTLAATAFGMDADNDSIYERALLGSTKALFGTLRMDSAIGSQQLDMRVPVRALYLSATPSTFAVNDQDSCTTIAPANIAISNQTAGTFATNFKMPNNLPAASTTLGTSPYSAGTGVIILRKPAPTAARGRADIAINLSTAGIDTSCNTSHPAGTTAANQPWLKGMWCTGAFADDPNASVTFGTDRNIFIYLREKY